MTTRRNCTGPRVTIPRLALSAACLLLMGGSALAQRGGDPQRVPAAPGQNPNGMHIYIWVGLKSHAVGLHDYPQFLADWSELLDRTRGRRRRISPWAQRCRPGEGRRGRHL